MQIATFVVAVLGLVLSAASLSWQTATFKLTGGRVKLELLVGAMHASGTGMILGSATNAGPRAFQDAASQGYTSPLVAVRVRNVGRMPVTVTSWSIVESVKGTALAPLGQSIGPALPYRLEAGSVETWAVDATMAQRLADVTADVFDVPRGDVSLCGRVELGDGRSHDTPEDMRL